MLKECGSIESCSNRMASVALIACCLFNILFGKQLHQDATALLLDMLMLKVDTNNKICLGIDFLLNDLPGVLRCFICHNYDYYQKLIVYFHL